MLLARNLRRVRTELLGLSQTFLSREIDWDYPAYSKIERGLQRVPGELIARIVKKFNINPSAFFFYDELNESYKNYVAKLDSSIAAEPTEPMKKDEGDVELVLRIDPSNPKLQKLLQAFLEEDVKPTPRKKK